jgi:hypothetical protein
MKLREKLKLFILRKQFDYAYTRLGWYTSGITMKLLGKKSTLKRAWKLEDKMYDKDLEIHNYSVTMNNRYA